MYVLRVFIVFIITSGFSTAVFSQVVNIENKRFYDDTAGWSGNIDLGLSAQQVKDIFVSANLKTHAQYKTRKHYYLLLSDIKYTGSKIVYSNTGMLHFRYAYRIKNGPWKWESYVQAQYNQVLLQKFRGLAGSGLRWKFYDNNKTRFFVGSSFFYEYEEILPSIYNNDVRWSSYLSLFIARPNFNFTCINYYQPLINNFYDFRISGQFTFLFKVHKKLDFKYEFTHAYDSRPPETVRSYVFSTTCGIVYKLKP